jgi:hypothetical protein
MPIQTMTFSAAPRVEPAFGEDALENPIKLKPSLTLAKGTVLGRVAADGLYKAYADAAVDGSGVARCILQYAVATDADGNHFIGAQASSEHGEARQTVPAWFSGNFKVAQLTGFDAAAQADLGARLIEGTNLADATAVVRIP